MKLPREVRKQLCREYIARHVKAHGRVPSARDARVAVGGDYNAVVEVLREYGPSGVSDPRPGRRCEPQSEEERAAWRQSLLRGGSGDDVPELEDIAEEVPDMLTVQEAAEKLGVSTESLRGRMKRARQRGHADPFERYGEGTRAVLYVAEDELVTWYEALPKRVRRSSKKTR